MLTDADGVPVTDDEDADGNSPAYSVAIHDTTFP
jgi:hypothetical protein